MNIEELDQNKWGVCGFVAAIQAAHDFKTTKRVSLDGESDFEIIMPSVNEFCNKHQDVEKDILDFSFIFGHDRENPDKHNPYKYSSINQILEIMQNDKDMSKEVGFAMPPYTMKILLQDLGFTQCEFHGTTSSSSELKFKYSKTIYGLSDENYRIGNTRKKMNFRYGLHHWVYVNEETDKCMTWGRYCNINEISKYFTKITHYIPLVNKKGSSEFRGMIV